jgi:hypothetical protein
MAAVAKLQPAANKWQTTDGGNFYRRYIWCDEIKFICGSSDYVRRADPNYGLGG